MRFGEPLGIGTRAEHQGEKIADMGRGELPQRRGLRLRVGQSQKIAPQQRQDGVRPRYHL